MNSELHPANSRSKPLPEEEFCLAFVGLIKPVSKISPIEILLIALNEKTMLTKKMV